MNSCSICNFETSNNKKYNQHLLSKSHQDKIKNNYQLYHLQKNQYILIENNINQKDIFQKIKYNLNGNHQNYIIKIQSLDNNQLFVTNYDPKCYNQIEMDFNIFKNIHQYLPHLLSLLNYYYQNIKDSNHLTSFCLGSAISGSLYLTIIIINSLGYTIFFSFMGGIITLLLKFQLKDK